MDSTWRPGSGPALGDVPTGGDELFDRGYALVGAVHRLVSTERAATKLDLVLAAACHALRGGDKSAAEIAEVVDRVWPGARVDQQTVSDALKLGMELGVVHRQSALDDLELWQLTPRGVAEVQEQERWVARVRSSTLEQLRERAESGLGVAPPKEKLELWLERIVAGLIGGIRDSQDAYLGRVDHLLQRRLAPRGIDQQRVMELIRDERSDPGTLEFLTASALAALDPLDPFASDLVSHITTGCVLHSYVAGRDSAAVLTELGSPANQRALLDTPVLVDLIGPKRVSENVEVTIEFAVTAGWEVVVCEHSLDELERLIEREIPRIQLAFSKAHAEGVRTEWYASLAKDQLPSYCVEVLRERTYQSLDEMRVAAGNLASRLSALGVDVRDHFNDNDTGSVELCRAALLDDLGSAPTRSDLVVQRDADSMAVVWRRRRREPAGSRWPGGWVITPDRHMRNAYRAVDRSDTVPLTLTMSQWTTLASVTVEPADVVALAQAAATQLVEEAMWLLPSRFPSEVALELARQISPEHGGSDTDLRVAQLTLDGTLSEAESRTPTSMAADVLEARARRREAQQTAEVDRARRAEEAALSAAAAASEQARIRQADAQSALLQSQSAQQVAQSLRDQLGWKSRQLQRVIVSLAVGFAGLAVFIIAVLLGASTFSVLSLGAGLAVWAIAAWSWCRQADARMALKLIAGAVEVVGLVSAVVGLSSDLG